MEIIKAKISSANNIEEYRKAINTNDKMENTSS